MIDISRNWFSAGCLSLATSVVLGAFGAHGMRHNNNVNFCVQFSLSGLKHKEPYYLEVWNKGVLYQTIHSFGMIVASLSPNSTARQGAGKSVEN